MRRRSSKGAPGNSGSSSTSSSGGGGDSVRCCLPAGARRGGLEPGPDQAGIGESGRTGARAALLRAGSVELVCEVAARPRMCARVCVRVPMCACPIPEHLGEGNGDPAERAAFESISKAPREALDATASPPAWCAAARSCSSAACSVLERIGPAIQVTRMKRTEILFFQEAQATVNKSLFYFTLFIIIFVVETSFSLVALVYFFLSVTFCPGSLPIFPCGFDRIVGW